MVMFTKFGNYKKYKEGNPKDRFIAQRNYY